MRLCLLLLLLALLSLLALQVGAEPRRGRRGGGRRRWSSSRRFRSSSSSTSRLSRSRRSSSSSRLYRSSRSRSSRRWFIASSSGGPRWAAQASARFSSFSSLKPVVERVRSNQINTWSGTKFQSASTLNSGLKSGYNKKQLGIGAAAGFLGGSGYGYGSGLASYSVYHRYQRYRWYKHRHYRHYQNSANDDYFDDDYYNIYYQRNSCQYGCPSNSHCEWGLCECHPSFYKSWGLCWQTGSPAPEPGKRADGGVCSNTTDCTATDINMVCSVSNEAPITTAEEVPDKSQRPGAREARCKCRKDTRWNTRALECQLYIDVDCSAMTYTSHVSATVQAAADTIVHQRRGWTTEEDKRDKILNMTRVQKDVYSQEELYEKYAQAQNSENGLCWYLMGDFSDSCKNEDYISQLAPENMEQEIPTNRTQTPSEAGEHSLLTSLASNNTNITEEELDEAFCRDTEAFSEVFQVDDLYHRPPDCPPLESRVCAVLYDRSECSEGTWQLPVLPATQKRLRFWSSDYKYRNDADVLGVRNGCTFTGWTASDFTGDTFKLTAGTTDRWVVFGKSQQFQRFDESILSFQCNCRD